jgi:HD-GYP domain-containing protein (c-di-GMP phosphodiesterase class II)
MAAICKVYPATIPKDFFGSWAVVMLKQIAVSDLQVGMFVHKFEGGWFDHPFWKAKFLIEDTEKLDAIRQSRVRAVVIDTERGRDLAPAARPTTASPVPDAGPAAPNRPASRLRNLKQRAAMQIAAAQPVTMAQELDNATAIAEQAQSKLSKAFIAARLGKTLDVRKVEPVVSDILASVRRNPQAFSGLMRCKLKNEQIFRHALSVSALMVALADRMRLPAQDVHNCGLAGLLLDIGVNYLPYAGDPPGGDYRNIEERVWQSHVLLGYRALQNDGDLPQLVLDACLFHHERMDGRGYPQRRAGEDIPLVARMAAICDSFDFRLSATDRAAGVDPAVAIAAMKADEGAYDPEILRLFVETVGLYPVGSFVVLESRKLAMVIDENRKDPLRPVVQAFYSLDAGERILPHRIALAQSNENERITGIADLTGLDLPEDAQLRELVFLSAYRGKANA